MSKFSLLFINVPFGKGENLTRAAVEAGSFGGTVLIGTDTAKSNLGAIIGLSEKRREIIVMLVERKIKEKIQNTIIEVSKKEKKDFGTMISIESNTLLKSGALTEGGITVENESAVKNPKNKMITVIVNKGYAEDAMFEARKAGAGGGTIMNARGTAREDDEKFFGMHIVPEKEMLLIIVPEEKYSAVLESIRNLKYLKEPGSGIAFVSDVEDFQILGKK